MIDGKKLRLAGSIRDITFRNNGKGLTN